MMYLLISDAILNDGIDSTNGTDIAPAVRNLPRRLFIYSTPLFLYKHNDYKHIEAETS